MPTTTTTNTLPTTPQPLLTTLLHQTATLVTNVLATYTTPSGTYILHDSLEISLLHKTFYTTVTNSLHYTTTLTPPTTPDLTLPTAIYVSKDRLSLLLGYHSDTSYYTLALYTTPSPYAPTYTYSQHYTFPTPDTYSTFTIDSLYNIIIHNSTQLQLQRLLLGNNLLQVENLDLTTPLPSNTLTLPAITNISIANNSSYTHVIYTTSTPDSLQLIQLTPFTSTQPINNLTTTTTTLLNETYDDYDEDYDYTTYSLHLQLPTILDKLLITITKPTSTTPYTQSIPLNWRPLPKLPLPFLLNTNKITKKAIDTPLGLIDNIFHDSWDNSNVEVEILPNDSTTSSTSTTTTTTTTDYDFKIKIKNTLPETNPITASPIAVIEPATLVFSPSTYYKLDVGDILLLSPKYKTQDLHEFYSTYTKYSNYKYQIVAKYQEEGINYILLNNPFPPHKNEDGSYISVDIYKYSTVILLNNFHIRSNPIQAASSKYNFRNKQSINLYSENTYNIPQSSLAYSLRLASYLLSQSGTYNNTYSLNHTPTSTTLKTPHNIVPNVAIQDSHSHSLHPSTPVSTTYTTDYTTHTFVPLTTPQLHYRTPTTETPTKYMPISSTDPMESLIPRIPTSYQYQKTELQVIANDEATYILNAPLATTGYLMTNKIVKGTFIDSTTFRPYEYEPYIGPCTLYQKDEPYYLDYIYVPVQSASSFGLRESSS